MDFRNFNHTFSLPANMPPVVCLESLVEVRSEVLEKSPVDKRRAQAEGWVQTRQRISGIALPILVRFSPSGT